MQAVVVEYIVKKYVVKKNTVDALKGVSFSVDKGEIFGIIGPDGAGKTSLFRILTTLLIAASGKATVDGFDVVKDFKQIRNRVGYMPGRFSLYQDLTVEENLEFFATIFGTTIQKNYHLIKDIYQQIEPFKTRRAGKLSGGMKQKLALCCALIHKPSVLFLDEPTTGVDAVSRKEFWDMLKRLKKQDITILVSTPYMDEAELCDRIALIQDGKILSINTPEGTVRSFKGSLFAVRADAMVKLLNDVRDNPRVHNCFVFGEFFHLSFKDNSLSNESDLIAYLTSKGHRNIELHPVQPSIEDCFIDFLKQEHA